MPSSVSALYEPMIARELDSVRPAVAEFRRTASAEELYFAVARFAVLAYAPSQHAKHAVMAALAAHDLREELGDRWEELLAECAYYAAASRQPWSEPPMMDPPDPGDDTTGDAGELRAAVRDRDRLRAERWLARRLDDPAIGRDLVAVAAEDPADQGMKLIVTDAALRLAAILGEKGRYVTLRMAVWELTAYGGSEAATRPDVEAATLLNRLIARSVAEEGSLESARAVFHFAAAHGRNVMESVGAPETRVPIYRLARDLAGTLIAHAVAKRLRADFPNAPLDAFLAAVHHNLETAPSLEDWSFA